MKLLSFIKENRVLVAGFTLPLLLVGLLAYAKTIPDRTIPDPQYKVAFIIDKWSGIGQVASRVDSQGHLSFSFDKNRNTYVNDNLPKPKVMIYDPSNNSIKEIEINITKPENGDIAIDLPPELDKLTFSSSMTAPDGYMFETYHSNGNSLLSDIFIGRNRYYGPALTNKSRVVRLPVSSNHYYGNADFIGWIASEGN